MRTHEIILEFEKSESRDHQKRLLALLRQKKEHKMAEELELDLLCEECNGEGVVLKGEFDDRVEVECICQVDN